MTDLLASVESAWRDHLRSSRQIRDDEPRDHVWASSRRACVRRMALDLLRPEERDELGDDTLERFEWGDVVELEVSTRLMHVGRRCDPPFDVIEGQRHFTIRDRDGSRLITGKIDGRLRFRGDGDERPVFEVKGGEAVRSIERLEDFDRSPWTRHMPDQLLAYLLAESEPWGFFVLRRPGVPRFIRVDLEPHLERAEAFLRDARTAIDARFGRTELPPYHDDVTECRRCPHLGRSCTPAIDYGPGTRIITDERLIELAEIRDRGAKAADEVWRAEGVLKRELRGVESAIMGPFHVRGRWQGAEPARRFLLRIERVGE